MHALFFEDTGPAVKPTVVSSFLLVFSSIFVQKLDGILLYYFLLLVFTLYRVRMVLCVFQSLVIWSALPIICLLLTLVIFLLYFCVRCCQRDSGHRKGTSCLKCWMVFFVLLAWYIIQIMHFSRKFGIQIWCSKLEMSRQELDISMEEHHIYFKSTLNNRFVSYLTKILTSNYDMQVGLGPGHMVLDGDPALPKRGTARNFRPMSVVAKP